jgi:hypothetical protein
MTVQLQHTARGSQATKKHVPCAKLLWPCSSVRANSCRYAEQVQLVRERRRCLLPVITLQLRLNCGGHAAALVRTYAGMLLRCGWSDGQTEKTLLGFQC